MTSYFIKYAKGAKDRGAKFIGYIDEPANEYNLTIEEVSGRLTTINFETDNIEYEEAYTPPYQDLSIIQPSNGSVTIGTGYVATYTPDLDYVGRDDFSVSYINNLGEVISKNINLNVISADITPDPYSFNNLVNQQVNTLVESNTIVVSGITMAVPISITNGQYQINGGTWTSSVGQVESGDLVKVRHTTSSSFETTVLTILNISGVTGNFSSTTTQEDATDYVNVNGLIKLLPSGSVSVDVTLSHALKTAYSVSGYVSYIQYGTPLVTPDKVYTIPAGSLIISSSTGLRWNRGDFSANGGELIRSTSSIPHNIPVICEDDVTRILNVNIGMQVEE